MLHFIPFSIANKFAPVRVLEPWGGGAAHFYAMHVGQRKTLIHYVRRRLQFASSSCETSQRRLNQKSHCENNAPSIFITLAQGAGGRKS